MSKDPTNSDDITYKNIDSENKNSNLIDAEGVCTISNQKPKKCCFVELNEGVSYFNLSTYYLVQFSYVCAFTFIDACQDYLLESPDYYNIDETKKGTINGTILLFDTLYLVKIIKSDCIYIYLWDVS